VRLHLQIDAPGFDRYEVVRSEVVPLIALGALSHGELSVAVNPDDPQDVAIDWSTVAAPRAPRDGASDPAAALAALADMRDRSLITDAEYAQKKQEILARL
jgi:hypothetical protein